MSIWKPGSPLYFALFFIWATAGPRIAFGQITGKSNLPDPKALTITADLESRLVDKIWFSVELKEIHRGTTDSWERHGAVSFDHAGKLIGQFDGEIGTWHVVNPQVLQIAITNGKKFLAGAYSIYQLTDSTLVLGQILTSSGDWVREYSFSKTSPVRKWPEFPPQIYPKFDSLRDATRMTYYQNGRIASIERYREGRFKIQQTDLFIQNNGIDMQDGTALRSVPTGTWIYYDTLGRVTEKVYYDSDGRGWKNEQLLYRTKGVSPIVLRTFHHRNMPGVYMIGTRDTILLNKVRLLARGQADSTRTLNLGLKNLSPRPVAIEFSSNTALSFSSAHLTVAGADSVTVNLPIRLPAGEIKEMIWFGTQEWKTYLDVDVAGYHLTDSDFQSGNDKILPQKFYILRNSDSYQIEVARAGHEQKPKLFPVSKQFTDVDLKKGRYQLTLVGPTSRKSINVEIR